jgi:peroxiredoxin/outer membrane lipoprotein-sorting protein
MTMTARIAWALGLACLLGTVHAADAQSTAPARKPSPPIIKKYAAAVRRLHTMSVIGHDVSRLALPNTFARLTLVKPNKVRLISYVRGKAVAGMISNGLAVSQWDEVDASRSNAPASYLDIAPAVHLNFVTNYTGILFAHPEVLENQPEVSDGGAVIFKRQRAHRVFSTYGGAKTTVTFSEATGLPLRFELVGSTITIELEFSDFEGNKAVADSAFVSPMLRNPKVSNVAPAPNKALLKPGTHAPDFTLTTLGGKRVTLSQFRGRVVLVDFWASWANQCRISTIESQNLQKELGSKGLTVLSVSTWDDKATMQRFVRDTGTAPKDVLFDPAEGTKAVAFARYHVTGLPTRYIIDKKGVIQGSIVGASMTDDKVLHDYLARLGVK